MRSIIQDAAKSVLSAGDPFITPLMRDVALRIMDDREASHRQYYFVEEQAYAQLFADMACWCEQTSRPMVTRQHVADRYIPNFEFCGTFVTCVPEEHWPEKG